MKNENRKPLNAAVLKLLRPLVRILLRYGVPYQSFCELAKWVYVNVADKEFGIQGRKQTVSRISVITGISRKEVLRMKRIEKPDDRDNSDKFNRAARVVAAWLREEDFLDETGNPARLPMAGTGTSFSELIRRFSGDVTPRATLDELIRVGIVNVEEDGKISLVSRSFVPEQSDTDILHILGKDVSHLISTLDHNLQTELKDPFFQREVAYDNLPDNASLRFRKLSGKKAQSFLEKMDKWLSRHDRDVNPEVKGKGRNHAGLGIYYFEEPFSKEET